MTQKDKAIRIAEALGAVWVDVNPKRLLTFTPDDLRILPLADPRTGDATMIPDYFGDLNVCWDAEMKLPVWMNADGEKYQGTRHHFRHELCLICSQPIHATAAERAEALYRTLCNNK